VLLEGQARAVEASAEAWKQEAEQANAVHVLEQILAATIVLARTPAEVIRSAWEELQDEARRSGKRWASQDAYQVTGESLATSLALTFGALDQVEECIRRAEARGYKVEGAVDFRIGHREALDAYRRFREGWPMLDHEEVKAARERIASGQYATLEDLARAVDAAD
jgi:hypothetical protein